MINRAKPRSFGLVYFTGRARANPQPSMKDSAQEKVPVTQTLSFCQMHFLSPLPVAFDRKLVSVWQVFHVWFLRARETWNQNFKDERVISTFHLWFRFYLGVFARANHVIMNPQETSTACPFSHYMCKEGLACNTWFLRVHSRARE